MGEWRGAGRLCHFKRKRRLDRVCRGGETETLVRVRA